MLHERIGLKSERSDSHLLLASIFVLCSLGYHRPGQSLILVSERIATRLCRLRSVASFNQRSSHSSERNHVDGRPVGRIRDFIGIGREIPVTMPSSMSPIFASDIACRRLCLQQSLTPLHFNTDCQSSPFRFAMDRPWSHANWMPVRAD